MDWAAIIQLVIQVVMAMIDKEKAGGIDSATAKARYLRSVARWSAVAGDDGESKRDRAVAGELAETFTCLAAADLAVREQILQQCQSGLSAYAAAKGGVA